MTIFAGLKFAAVLSEQMNKVDLAVATPTPTAERKSAENLIFFANSSEKSMSGRLVGWQLAG